MKKRGTWFKTALQYIGLSILGYIFLFPLLWMFFGTFKDNRELFSSMSLIPKEFRLDGYINGWRGSGQFTYTTFFLNTFLMVIPTALFTVFSSLLVGYGFARFNFRFKKVLFAIMIGTMMLPNAVLIIPRYLLYNAFGWIDSYKVFWVPALFGCYPFFIYMFVQFFRGIPKELDEAAKIDGCGSFRTLVSILLPLLKPVIVSAFVFQIAWTWEDFFNPLIFISSTSKYPLSLALRMSLDAATAIDYGSLLAMATVTIMPVAVLFFIAQKSFVEGISTTGIKG
jgi:oligogalacturonide transport system permease protein